MKVVEGYDLPCVDGATHSLPIPLGYARVGVDDVQEAWRVLRLDISGGDEVETLGEAVNNIILWKKKDIVFPKPPSPLAPPSPAITSLTFPKACVIVSSASVSVVEIGRAHV